MSWVLIKLAIRFVVFGLVFGVVSWREKRVQVRPTYALPLVAAVFALINTGLYWLLKPILNLATLGSMAFAMPLLLNGVFVYVTARVLKPLKIEGLWPMLILASSLTIAHGALWLGLDYVQW